MGRRKKQYIDGGEHEGKVEGTYSWAFGSGGMYVYCEKCKEGDTVGTSRI